MYPHTMSRSPNSIAGRGPTPAWPGTEHALQCIAGGNHESCGRRAYGCQVDQKGTEKYSRPELIAADEQCGECDATRWPNRGCTVARDRPKVPVRK